MTISAQDLLSPVGPVDGSLFPGEPSNVLEARLDQYIQNGYDDERVAAEQDASLQNKLVKAYALYQVFNAVYIRMSTQPLTLAVTEKGSHGYTFEQIRAVKMQADKYLSDFNGLLSVLPESTSGLPGTTSSRFVVEW